METPFTLGRHGATVAVGFVQMVFRFSGQENNPTANLLRENKVEIADGVASRKLVAARTAILMMIARVVIYIIKDSY